MHRDATTVRPLSSRTRHLPSASPTSTPAITPAITPAWCRRR